VNLRHAAALALMGWYLMLAPSVPSGSNAPLSNWRTVGSYDSAEACNENKEQSLKDLLRDADQKKDEQWGQVGPRRDVSPVTIPGSGGTKMGAGW
jgi:hypothetical protein